MFRIKFIFSHKSRIRISYILFQLASLKKMFSNSMIFKLLIIFLTASSVFSDYQYSEVNLVCSRVTQKKINHISDKLFFCESTISIQTFFNTRLNNVYIAENVVKNKSSHINALSLKNMTNFTFLPFEITKDWNLKAFEIENSGLMHIDQHDMQQFGMHILHVRFFRTKLTVLENNLFQFNPNLISISFELNPLKHIGPMFFENLKKMRHLKDAKRINCKDETFLSFVGLSSPKYDSIKCHDFDSLRDFISTVQFRKKNINNRNQFDGLTQQISNINKVITNHDIKIKDLFEKNNVTRKIVDDFHDENQIARTELKKKIPELQSENKNSTDEDKYMIMESKNIQMLMQNLLECKNSKLNLLMEPEILIIYCIMFAFIITSFTLFTYIILTSKKLNNKITIDKVISHELQTMTDYHNARQFEEADTREIYNDIANCTSSQSNEINIEFNQSSNNLQELYAVVDRKKGNYCSKML